MSPEGVPRIALALISWTVATGCRTDCAPTLSQVPIEGDWSTAQLETLRAELEAFDTALKVPVCVAHLRGRASPRYDGRFNSLTDGISLAERLEPEALGPVLRHELCHAIDQTNLVVRTDPGLWPRSIVHHERWAPRRESFARWCSAPPVEAWRLAGPSRCADPRDERLLDDVFHQADLAHDVVLGPIVPLGFTLEPGQSFVGWCRDDGDIWLRVDGYGAWTVGADRVPRQGPTEVPVDAWGDRCDTRADNPPGWTCPANWCSKAELPSGRTVSLHSMVGRNGPGPNAWIVRDADGSDAASLDLCAPEFGSAMMLHGDPVLIEIQPDGALTLRTMGVP